MLDEGVEEFVVEGLVPGLAGEHCAEVRFALAHDGFEVDHGGALRCHCHVLGRGRDPDDAGAVVGEDWLVLRDAQLELRVCEPHPHQNVHQPRPAGGPKRLRTMHLELSRSWNNLAKAMLAYS